MKCLIVGGTGFLGGAIADAIAADGHDTTILSRGKVGRQNANGVKTISADRFGDLSILKEYEFDWVLTHVATHQNL